MKSRFSILCLLVNILLISCEQAPQYYEVSGRLHTPYHIKFEHTKPLDKEIDEQLKYFYHLFNAFDSMKAKQLNKGIEQLMDEGVAQLFTNQFNGRKIIGTVGQLQFEVIQYRLLHEYAAQCKWEPISLYKACWIESDNQQALENFKKRKAQYMALDKEGRDVYLADSGYVLMMAQQDFPDIKFHFTSEF